jgi:hypothetical protein
MIDMAMLIAEIKPDANGNVIPPSVLEGSASFENAKGNKVSMTLVVAGGIYNVFTATCGNTCVNCCGYSNFGISVPVYCPIGQTMACSDSATNCYGTVQDWSGGTWSSSNPSIMTVDGSGNVTGVAVGSVLLTYTFANIPVYTGQICTQGSTPACPTGSPQSNGGSTVTPSITVHFTGSQTQGDTLSFSNVAQTCSTTLGLKDCSSNYPSAWVWNVEIEADVDDAGNYTVSQGLTGLTKGFYKDTNGNLQPFSTSTNKPAPQDNPPATVLQRVSGQKAIFWIDAPGRGTLFAQGEPISSMTDVKNFTSSICSTANPNTCYSVQWYIKIVVKSGGVLDTTNSAAGFGSLPLNF